MVMAIKMLKFAHHLENIRDLNRHAVAIEFPAPD